MQCMILNERPDVYMPRIIIMLELISIYIDIMIIVFNAFTHISTMYQRPVPTYTRSLAREVAQPEQSESQPCTRALQLE